MIKLKNLVEVIGKDKGSDSLANSRAKEFQGALTGLKKDIAVIERMIKDYKGGRPGKRKGDINYKLWSSRGFLIKISDITSKFNLIQDISNNNEKQSKDIESKIKAGTLKIKEVNSIVGVGYSNPEAQQLSVDAVNKAAKEIGKAQRKAVSIFTSDMKNKKYDNMDLANSIKQGNIRDASLSKRDLLSKLYFDVRDRFNKYNRRKK